MRSTPDELAYARAYRASHKEIIAARNAAYYATHKAEIAANNAVYYAANREKKVAYSLAYYAAHRDEQIARRAAWAMEHPGAARKNGKRMRQLYPERAAARAAVKYEVRTGRWPPANMQVCEICGEAQAQQYHHHLGYEPEHWLHAQAVCKECHMKEHKGERP